jgi:hypothetical protein
MAIFIYFSLVLNDISYEIMDLYIYIEGPQGACPNFSARPESFIFRASDHASSSDASSLSGAKLL